MLEAAQDAVLFVRGKDRAALDGDRLPQYALVRAIEIIGEAATAVSAESRTGYPETPWRNIIAMRNRLIHAYFDINLDTIWRLFREFRAAWCIGAKSGGQ